MCRLVAFCLIAAWCFTNAVAQQTPAMPGQVRQPKPDHLTVPSPLPDAKQIKPPIADVHSTQRDFLKSFNLESFGVPGNVSEVPGYENSAAYRAQFYNLQGFECPLCIPGMPNRTQLTLPPFGANARYRFKSRVEFFGKAGGTQAYQQEGIADPTGARMFSNHYGNAWLMQAEAGARMAVDKNQRIWVQVFGRKSYNPSSETFRSWSTVGAGLSVEHLGEAIGSVKKSFKGLQSPKNEAE